MRRCVIIGPKNKKRGFSLRIGRTSERSREAEKALGTVNVTPQQFLNEKSKTSPSLILYVHSFKKGVVNDF